MVTFLNTFCEILVKKFIPMGWAKADGWNQKKPNRLASVPLYFSRIHTLLKAQFGPQGHEYLQGCSSKSLWWKAMKLICLKGYSKEVFIGEDEIFKTSTRPLYLCLPRANIRYEGKLTETIEKIDILSIVDSMLEESTKESLKEGIIDWLKLLHTFYSMGRNWEHGDTRFSGMGWDALLNCADIGIRERKTKQHYALEMTNYCKADTKKYKVCYMHAMALAMVADTDILIRCDDDKNEDFLFSDVQENEASYAGTQLTNMIRKHIKLLHPDISEKNLLEYTVKSPRKGSITFGIIHRDLTLVEVAARSRHNIGDNMQTYIDFAGLAITLCSALALNEYPDIRVIPYHATFDSLSGSDSLFIQHVVNELFPTNMDDFQSSG